MIFTVWVVAVALLCLSVAFCLLMSGRAIWECRHDDSSDWVFRAAWATLGVMVACSLPLFGLV